MKMPNGYGTVYKLKGKRRKPWIAIAGRTYDADNKEVRHIIGYTQTRQEALAMLAEYNKDPFDTKTANKPFSEIYQMWYDSTVTDETSNAAKGNYNVGYKGLTPLHGKPFKNIKLADLENAIAQLEDRQGVKKRAIVLLHKMYAYAVRHEIVVKDYSKLIAHTQYKQKEFRNAFTSEEISKVYYDGSFTAIVVSVLIFSGLRISELLELKKENLDLEHQYAKIVRAKTEAGVRILPIPDFVLPYWQYLTQQSDSPYVVSSEFTNKLSYSNFHKNYFTPFCGRLNINHTIHETRHTFASIGTMAGINETALKKILGHIAQESLTERVYTHFNLEYLLSEINKIPEPIKIGAQTRKDLLATCCQRVSNE